MTDLCRKIKKKLIRRLSAHFSGLIRKKLRALKGIAELITLYLGISLFSRTDASMKTSSKRYSKTKQNHHKYGSMCFI